MGGSSGGGLTKEQQAQLKAMLTATRGASTSLPASLLAVGSTPYASGNTTLGADALATIRKRQGYKATVKTGTLGDAGFGTSLSKPALGATG